MDTQKKKRFILAFDSLSGLVAGSFNWLLAPVLVSIHEWTLGFARLIALGNLGYGLYSGTLFLYFRKQHNVSFLLLTVLVAANFGWAIQCLVQAWRLRAEATHLGLGHLIFEAVYVGLVGYYEAKIFFGAPVGERAGS